MPSSEPTRQLLANPLYLHLFMQSFDRLPAEDVATAPALFRRFVDQAVRDHPGLEESIDAVIAHLLADVTRASANLADDDVNAIRALGPHADRGRAVIPVPPRGGPGARGLVAQAEDSRGSRLQLRPQTIAEYLIYQSLARSRPADEDELAYWTHRAAPDPVFPEYAGAFGFLLRDWAESKEGKLGLAARIVETSPGWFDDVLVAFLKEQAELGHMPAQTSPRAKDAAAALAGGGVWNAKSLDRAASDLAFTRLAPEAAVYLQASLAIREALWKDNPSEVQIGDGLGSTLNNLGVLLRDDGRVEPAEAAYRRSVEIYEALWNDNPRNVEFGDGLGFTLNNLGNLLSDDGRVEPAEAAFRRSVEIYEALWMDNPRNVEIGDGLGRTLNNLGILLSGDGRVEPAETAFRRSVEIRETLRKDNPRNVQIGDGLGSTLNNLGVLLRADGRVEPAEAADRRSVEIYEALWKDNPGNVQIGYGLGSTLNNLALLLSADGRVEPAEVAYQRSVEIYEALWKDNPRNVQIGDGLGLTLNNLGNLLSTDGRVEPAEAAYRRSVETYEALWNDNPRNVQIRDRLGSTLNNLGLLLSADGRVEPAEAAYRRSVDIREALWKDNPKNVEITAGYAGSLCNVGRLDEAEQRVDEVLAKMPRHPYANELKRHIVANRPPSGERAMISDQATADVKRPWWKRWMGGK